MHTLKYPEDSVLRRHFDTTVDFNRERWLHNPPSDSILRRHAMSQIAHAGVAGTGQAGSRSTTARVSPSRSTAKHTAEEQRGFFARLFGMFTGRA